MGSLLRKFGNAMSVLSTDTEDYGKLAARGVDYRAITPVMQDSMPTVIPELVESLEVLPNEIGQDTAAKARETSEMMLTKSKIAKDIADDMIKTMDSAKTLDDHQLRVSLHYGKTQDALTANRVKYQLARNAQNYSRSRNAGTLFGSEKGYGPTAMQKLFAR